MKYKVDFDICERDILAIQQNENILAEAMHRTPLQALDIVKAHVFRMINSKIDAQGLYIVSDVKYNAEWIACPKDNGEECNYLNITCSFEAKEKEPENTDNE